MSHTKASVVVFEEIFASHRWIIRWYLLRKKQVFFIRLSVKASQQKWFQEFFSEGKLKKVDFNFKSVGIWEGANFDAAFDHAEEIFGNIKEARIVKEIQQLYRSEHIDLAYKSVMHLPLARFCYLKYTLEKIQQRFPEKICLFVTANRLHFYKATGYEINEYMAFMRMMSPGESNMQDNSTVGFALWTVLLSHLSYGLNMFKGLVMILVFPFWVLLKILIGSANSGHLDLKKHYTNVFRVFPVKEQIDNRIPRFDFLIDQDQVKKNDSLFVSYQKLHGTIKEYVEAKNMPYIDDLNAFFNLKDLRRVAPLFFTLLRTFFKNEYYISIGSLKLIYFYLRWNGFSRQILIDNFISFSDSGVESIARNVIFKKIGIRSFYYMDSSNFGCFYTTGDTSSSYRSLIGYVCYDYFISWGSQVSDYLKESKCQFEYNVDAGCLWSEPIRLVCEGKIESNFKQELYQNGFQDHMKLIALFDSTFHDASITSYDQGVQFFKDIMRLLDDDGNIFIVIKEKKSRAHHKRITSLSDQIEDLYSQMSDHPRVMCVKNAFHPSEMIALSDLTVSFPFTSPSLEAIAARKKALWHDGAKCFCGVFYDQFPGMVTHSYDEFLTRVNQLIYSTSEEEYNEYLDTHVKGKIESFLDGKAISRFKQCLVNGVPDEKAIPKQPAFSG